MPAKYRYIFGPIYSKRFGLSLGVDLLGAKICSMNCPYCEISKTKKLTLERKAYVSGQAVIEELSEYLDKKEKPAFQYITFSGKGEPLLNSEIGQVIAHIKKHYSYKVVILTNASHLHDSSVRQDILQADIIMPSLDACSEAVFLRVNKPHRALSVKEIVAGIQALREEFAGDLWLEILFVQGVNDSETEIAALKQHVLMIQPHRVYVNTVYRPPAFANVAPVSPEFCAQVQQDFDALLLHKRLETPARECVGENMRDSELFAQLEMVLQVRPSTRQDLEKIFCGYGGLEEVAFTRVLEQFLCERKPLVKKFCGMSYYLLESVAVGS